MFTCFHSTRISKNSIIKEMLIIKRSRSLFFSVNKLCKLTVTSNRGNCDQIKSKERDIYPLRIFSGIQPTGSVHLGNYLGAIKEWVRYQNLHSDVIWSIVDMHAITLPQNPIDLRENIMKLTATLIACGIDPAKSILFQQSTVPMHAELAWILGCMTTMPRLYQQPQFKEKSSNIQDIPLGLFTYPVLQTADILLYKATHVPIGDDQKQHLNLAIHLAQFFNSKYGNTFPLPEPIITELGNRIKSLREPTKKMSKSSEYKKSVVTVVDPPEIILKHIKKAVTDFTSEVTYEPNKRPGVANLVMIHSLLTGKSTEEICKEMVGVNTGKYKLIVADVVIETLKPIRQKYEELLQDPGYLNGILKNGTDRAMEIASTTMAETKLKIGFSGGILSKTENSKQQCLTSV